MKQEKSGIMFLLSILGLLSLSTGIMHMGNKNEQAKPVPFMLIDALGDMTPQEIRREIDPFIFSHSIYSAAKALNLASPVVIKEVLHDLLAKSNPLTRDEKILLVILVAHSSEDKKVRYSFYDMLLAYPDLQKGKPILAVGATVDDPNLIRSILGWMAFRKRQGDAQYVDLKNWVKSALQYLVHDNDFTGFKRLFEQRIRVGSQFASLLLLRAIQENRDPRFIPYLISKGVKPNFVGPNKRTLLMEAVLQKNQKMVEELLNLGADPNYIVDPAIGSAIQLAYERGYVDLELLMRRYAEEKNSKKVASRKIR